MEEYQANGCRLGWLVDPKNKRVAVYQGDHPVQILEAPDTLSGEDVLVEFELDARFLWNG
jgi:Uma2 family endonuclease